MYLKRLMFLHLGRVQALKRLSEIPPEVYSPTETCGYSEKSRLLRAWSLAISSLARDIRPGM